MKWTRRRWSLRSKIGLILAAIMILIMLASRANVGPATCGISPVGSSLKDGPKCG